MTRILIGLAAACGLAAFAAPAAADSHESAVSVLHGVPGLTVDVYVNGELTLEDFRRLVEPTEAIDVAAQAARRFEDGRALLERIRSLLPRRIRSSGSPVIT